MKIAIAGATGLVGTALTDILTAGGHQVSRLLRVKKAGELFWSPEENVLDSAQLEGFDAVVNLAGENIASDRWTDAKKKLIRDSRVNSTRLLSSTLATLSSPPSVLVNASALGYYGNRGDEVLTESSTIGTGFLANVVQEWEAATEPASSKGIRVALMRIGVVLSPKGGAMSRLLPIFQMGGGGILGSGKQYMSWIDLEDVARAFHRAIMSSNLEGPINTAAPHPVTNAEFTKVLGKVLMRPTLLPLPAPAARLMMGEMADELLLSSQRLQPAKLEENGFQFQYPTLEQSLRHLLGKAK
ncbi:MAG: TIGR01777 family oxidoreductase [Candidatus Obscuribacterales bacterium]|nr:TIGR01777 family oxidoreductase [Candidatus Obscuribacterales bacterium]